MTTIYTSKKEFSEAATINTKFSITDGMKKAFPSLKDYDFYDFKIEDDKMTIVAFKKEPEKLEPINPNKFQIVKITSEMKAEYPTLKKYKELIVSGEEMNWYDADEYAKKNRAILPDEKEGRSIVHFIKESGWNKYFWFWTREEYSSRDDAYICSIDYNGKTQHGGKRYSGNCFCVR